MATGTRPRDWADVDYYAVLGIAEDADDETIGRAFRTLAKQLHPDAGATERDVERFKDVAGAYEVLGDRKIRREYDRVRAELAAARDERIAYGNRSRVADPFAPRDYPPGRPMPAFAARRVRPRRGFTRRRAWLAAIGGLVIFAGGVVVGLVTLSLHYADARIHDDTVATRVTDVTNNGRREISFVT
ncbi:MAG TPA: J domain-containing protein, partial [Acidimicrobiia bacterium]|nr:J domain-containing protein [Acidimicrobiia bacterium]